MSTDQKGCMDRNECLDLPCLNGASCINLEPKFRYRCVCLDGFWGENCELVQEGQTLKLSMGALAAILVCLLIILSEHSMEPNKPNKKYSTLSTIILPFYKLLFFVGHSINKTVLICFRFNVSFSATIFSSLDLSISNIFLYINDSELNHTHF